MQVEETKAEGLIREFSVTVAATDIETRVQDRLAEVGKTVKMPGFRPGKVPPSLLRKRFGPQIIGEVLEQAISSSTEEALKERALRPALQPRVRIDSFDEGKDLCFTIAVELMPEIAPVDFAGITIERPVVDVTDAMVTEALQRIADQRKVYEKVDEDRPATREDAVLVDFTGRVGGEAFPGGTAKDYELQLDSEGFIPGFLEQLQGLKAGETRTIAVTFPEDYGAKDLAGKAAEFEVVVKELRARKPVEVTEDLAKAAGLESLDAMKQAVHDRLSSEYQSIARMQVKRALLDALAGRVDFDPPPSLVESEFRQIWSSLTGVPVPSDEDDHGHDHDHDHDHDHGHDHGHEDGAEQPRPDPAAQARFRAMLEETGKSEDDLKEEYRTIAERRVKLGILLSETGRENNITVGDDEVNRALANEARRFPGQERQVVEYYQKNRAALEQLRAPLFEDKVVDFILELAHVNDRSVTAEELMAAAQNESEDESGDDSDESSGKSAAGIDGKSGKKTAKAKARSGASAAAPAAEKGKSTRAKATRPRDSASGSGGKGESSPDGKA